MTKTKAEAIVSEVSSRLDDLFGETKQSGPSLNDKDLIAPQESPILDLNAIVLSIDWEITDEILAKFMDEISRLKALYRDDPILSSFLKIHGSVGKYLSTQKVNAHPDAIRLLQSLFDGFEKVVTSPEMKEVEKKKILSAEVAKFKQLREQVLLAPKGVPPKKDLKLQDLAAKAPLAAEANLLASQEFLDHVREEIIKIIKAEFRTLKDELKLLIQG